MRKGKREWRRKAAAVSPGRESRGGRLRSKDVNGWRRKRKDRLAWWEDPWHLCTSCSVDLFETREHA